MISQQQRASFVAQLKPSRPQLSIGTLTGDMMHQANDIALLEQKGIPLLHVDVMDGQAWPKITVGSPFVAGLKTSLLKDIHLLVDQPENHISDFANAGADIITFALEHSRDVAKTLQLIEQSENSNDPNRPILRSVSIYPNTDFEQLTAHLDNLDVVFVLSVSPTTGKECFFDTVQKRVKQLRELKPELLIAIDGGVKVSNISEIAAIAPDFIVTGSAVFDGKDPAANIDAMESALA